MGLKKTIELNETEIRLLRYLIKVGVITSGDPPENFDFEDKKELSQQMNKLVNRSLVKKEKLSPVYRSARYTLEASRVGQVIDTLKHYYGNKK